MSSSASAGLWENHRTRRHAMLQMNKIEIDGLRRAYESQESA
jgi:hypothetical protein